MRKLSDEWTGGQTDGQEWFHMRLSDKCWASKNVYLFKRQGHTNKMDSEYLENYVWTYAHASDSDQGVVLWGIWLLCSCDNKKHCLEIWKHQDWQHSED